jgi:chaperone modulatory protein CbpM
MRGTLSIEALVEELWLDLEALCRATGADAAWVQLRVSEGLVPEAEAGSGRYDASAVLRVRRLLRLERDFDALPEVAALVADLEDEIARLRRRLAAHGLD